MDNVFNRYMHYHNAYQDERIIDELWAKPGAPRCGRATTTSGIYTTYESVTAYHRGRPQPVGKLLFHYTTTPVIEVAADGETAKGIWIMAGLESGLIDPEVAKDVPPWVFSGGEVDGKPVWAHWVWCKYGVDFIKQDGEWRIWHFRCYEVARAPFNRDWISFAKDNQESHDSQLAWFGDDGVPVVPAAGRRADLHDGLPPVRERQGADARARARRAVRRRSRTRSSKKRSPVPPTTRKLAAGPCTGAAAPVQAPPRRPGVVLAVACAAQFVCVLDTSIVNVALPPMQDSLGLSPTGLQWVVSSYTLTFAGFLLLGGRVGDLFGRKRRVRGGPACCSPLASLAAGLAQEGWQVVAARFAQGVGGAVLVPTTLSLVTTGFPDPRAQGQGAEPAHGGGRVRRGARRRDRRPAHRPAQLALGLLRQRAAGGAARCSPRCGRCPAGHRATSAGGSTCPARWR